MTRIIVVAAVVTASVCSGRTEAQVTPSMLFVANGQSADVSRFEVAADGTLTPDPKGTVSPGQHSLSLAALTPDGSFLLTIGGTPSIPLGAELAGVRIGADGSMTLQPGLTTTVATGPNAMAVARRDGRTFVYLFPFEPIVYAYELVDGTRGPALPPVRGQPFASPGFTYFGDAAATPDGRFLYVGKAFVAGLTGFVIGEDGSLTLLSMPELAALDHFRTVAVSPDGRHLYAATHADVPGAQTAHIRAYAIADDGLLDELPGSPFSSSPVERDRVTDLAITPSGDRLVALNFISNTLTLLTRGVDGSLTPTFRTQTFLHQLTAIQTTDSYALALVQVCFGCDESIGSGVFPMHITMDGTLEALTSEPIQAGQTPVALSLRLAPTIDPVAGDLNSDGVVNAIDLGILLSNWSIPPTAPACGGAQPCSSDINGDGFVNSIDLGILLSSWTL